MVVLALADSVLPLLVAAVAVIAPEVQVDAAVDPDGPLRAAAAVELDVMAGVVVCIEREEQVALVGSGVASLVGLAIG